MSREQWTIGYKQLRFKISPTGFKHTGLFPEQAVNWDFMADKIQNAGRPVSVLNLFAYTGGATLACAQAGAKVCHVDASKGMVSWARENAQLSGLQDRPIRWIVDDCKKFVEREIRRGNRYEMCIRDSVRTAIKKNMQVMGIRRGYNGLINGDMSEMNIRSVSNVLHRGGTMLLTARCNEFKTEEGQMQAVGVCKELGIDGLIIIGGDGSFMGCLLYTSFFFFTDSKQLDRSR